MCHKITGKHTTKKLKSASFSSKTSQSKHTMCYEEPGRDQRLHISTKKINAPLGYWRVLPTGLLASAASRISARTGMLQSLDCSMRLLKKRFRKSLRCED